MIVRYARVKSSEGGVVHFARRSDKLIDLQTLCGRPARLLPRRWSGVSRKCKACERLRKEEMAEEA